ncbi:S41 family peptidase [Shewanella khirikhana]|uniref:S41 family peptidase n=1 Tax=Shewanella khirikhana TaxID=1965282 RepID=UPI0030CD6833
MRYFTKHALTLALLAAVGACSGGGGTSDSGNSGNSGNNGNSGSDITWVQGSFASEDIYKNFCANPRSGTADKSGSALHEKMWLRSWTNNTYLWYSEVPDNDPDSFGTVIDYFAQLKTPLTTPSGAKKDRFHSAMSTEEWEALSNSGEAVGYGVEFQLLSATEPRKIVAAYTEPGSVATAVGIVRGTEFLEANGVVVANGDDVNTLNEAFFPSTNGKTSTFKVRDPDGTERTISMTAGTVVQDPVQNVKAVATASGKVGYLQFNSHIATSEKELVDAISTLKAEGINDLVLDVRYNGGGLLAIASQLGYMIAGPTRTSNKIFENTTFNDKHASTNPVTNQALVPMPFIDTGIGFSYTQGVALPHLDLGRVFILTTSGTCSASEAIINGLRGIDLDVVQIGNRTCGKPYGFYPTDNCGTTYFSIQFRGENNKGFGDYADGFEPANTPVIGGEQVTGCYLNDDFSHQLGDPNEALFAAALQYRVTQSCPAPAAASFAVQKAPAKGSGEAMSDTREVNLFKTNRVLTKVETLQQ